MRLRRSVLITPAIRGMLEKAAQTEVDVAWIELEDGIHPEMKVKARAVAISALRDVDWHGKERVVRVNSMHSQEGPEDIRAIVPAAPDAFVLAKVEDPDEVVEADRIITEVESSTGSERGAVRLWCMVETAKALVKVEALATATPRMTGLFFGGGDLSADLKVKRIGLGHTRVLPWLEGLQVELLYAKSRVVAAARAANISAIDVPYQGHTDVERTHLDALYSFQLGFDGKVVISPRQIGPVHRAWAPTEEDLDWAVRVLDEFEAAGHRQETVTVVDNEMVDGPFVRNARMLVERQRATTRATAG